MAFDWPLESAVEADELLAAKLRAARLLGRLDGELSGLGGLAAEIFAGLALRRSWAAVGLALNREQAREQAVPLHRPERRHSWLDSELAAPDGLRDLWLAHCATLPLLAGPAAALQKLLPPALEPDDEAEVALQEALAHWAVRAPKAPPADPFEALMTSLAHASASPRFQQGRPEYLRIARSDGVAHAAAYEGHRAQSWALALTCLAALPGFDLATRALPLAGAVPRLVLRQDLHADDRCLGLCEALAKAAIGALEDMAQAHSLARRATEALPDIRASSRAPQAFALIAGLGGLRRQQLAALLGSTEAGADQALARLQQAGLIGRLPGDRRGAFHVLTKSRAPDFIWAESLSATLPASVAALDAALAILDALLPDTAED
jgi:hypothetical protein